MIAYILGFIFHLGELGVYWGIVSGVIIGSAVSYLYFRLFLRELKKKVENTTSIN